MPLESQGWSAEPVTRVFAGVSLGTWSGRLKTAILRCRGEGWGLRCPSADAITAPAPKTQGLELVEEIRAGLLALSEHLEIPLTAIDVLGIHGFSAAAPMTEISCALSERTGITTVHSFEHRDRAAGGRGEPLSPIPDWLLLRNSKLNRLLVDLGVTLRATVLWANEPAERTLSFDVGPCGGFLDSLSNALSAGHYPFDPHGHFAVQGRNCPELIANWLSHPFLLRPVPRFLSDGDFGTDFLEATLAIARQQKLNACDVLCSASTFIIRSLSETIRKLEHKGRNLDEIVVTGGGSRNAFLWKLVLDQFNNYRVHRLDDLGLPLEARPAYHAALLAYLTMENLHGNLPHLTGARDQRILGQISPGSTSNWDNWVCNLADQFDISQNRAA